MFANAHLWSLRLNTGHRIERMLTLAVLVIWAAIGLPPHVLADGLDRAHEVRLSYEIDSSFAPEWLVQRETSFIVEIGPALDVVATVDGRLVSCLYDGQKVVVSLPLDASGLTSVELVVTGPIRSVEEIGAPSLATLKYDKRWALSITFDDGYVSQATTAKDLLGRYGYAGSIAVVGDRIGVENWHDRGILLRDR